MGLWRGRRADPFHPCRDLRVAYPWSWRARRPTGAFSGLWLAGPVRDWPARSGTGRPGPGLAGPVRDWPGPGRQLVYSGRGGFPRCWREEYEGG
jgi:hypothetical protein